METPTYHTNHSINEVVDVYKDLTEGKVSFEDVAKSAVLKALIEAIEETNKSLGTNRTAKL